MPASCIPGIPDKTYGPLSRSWSGGATVSEATQSGPQQKPSGHHLNQVDSININNMGTNQYFQLLDVMY